MSTAAFTLPRVNVLFALEYQSCRRASSTFDPRLNNTPEYVIKPISLACPQAQPTYQRYTACKTAHLLPAHRNCISTTIYPFPLQTRCVGKTMQQIPGCAAAHTISTLHAAADLQDSESPPCPPIHPLEEQDPDIRHSQPEISCARCCEAANGVMQI